MSGRRSLGASLHRLPAASAIALLAGTIAALLALFPLQYDFSFTSLFVGEGDEYDALGEYLNRFGADVNVVVVTIEAEQLFSEPVMAEIDALTRDLERIEGVAEVVSPVNVSDLVGDGGELRTRDVVPRPLPTDSATWDEVRSLATTHPLLTGNVFAADGTHAAMVVRFGVESSDAACVDGVDNDGGGAVDCHDSGCARRPLCGAAELESGNAACTNGLDDDGDGALDCDDADCADAFACAWARSAESTPGACSDGVDNDDDGAVDCADRDCIIRPDVGACDATDAVVARVRATDARARDAGWGAFHLGGIPVVGKEYTRVIQHDLRTYLPLTGGLVGIVLLLLFRSGRGVILPLGAVAVSTLWALGALMATGGKLNMINSSMPTLLLVIGIADAVHVVSRYLEESETADTPAQAASRSMRHMAPACLLTSVTSAVGFGTLLTAQLPIIRGFGGYTALGIMLAFVVAMLALPPTLALLPLPSEAARQRARAGKAMADRVTAVFVRAIFDHRRATLVSVALVLLVATLGAVQVESDSELMEELSPDNPVSQANEVIERSHGGVLSGAILFYGEPGAFIEPDALRALDEIAAFAEAWRWEGEPLVSNTFSLADIVKEAHEAYRGDPEARVVPDTRAAVSALLDQVPPDDRAALVSADYATTHLTLRQYSVGSRAWRALRDELTAEIDARSAALGGARWSFTGSSTLAQDALGFMIRDLLTSLLLAFALIMALMSVLFRSFKVGLLSMIPNLFPLLITLAVVGYAGIDIRVSTAVVFSISLGIAVDDTIHLLVRFREELQREGTSYEEALVAAIAGAGRAVVFTTVILCVGFGVLTMSEFTAVRELGILGGVTLIGALIGDLVVLPLALLKWRPAAALRASGGADSDADLS